MRPHCSGAISIAGVYPADAASVRAQICSTAVPHAPFWIYNCDPGRAARDAVRLPGDSRLPVGQAELAHRLSDGCRALMRKFKVGGMAMIGDGRGGLANAFW